MPKKSRAAREQQSPGPSPSINAPVAGIMAWAAQLHAVMQQHAWVAVVQTPGGVAGQFAHQALLVALRTQQAGAAGDGAAVAAVAGGSVNETLLLWNRCRPRSQELGRDAPGAPGPSKHGISRVKSTSPLPWPFLS